MFTPSLKFPLSARVLVLASAPAARTAHPLSRFCPHSDYTDEHTRIWKCMKHQRTATTSPPDQQAVLLYERQAPPLFAYLRLHAPSWEDAEDLLLDVFLAAIEQQRPLAWPEREQLAWLLRVAQHKLVDHHRRTSRRPTVPFEDVAEVLEGAGARTPEQLALDQEELQRLHAAVRRLPRPQQEVLRLRFAEGLRCTQIAALLGKRHEAVRQVLSRTLNQLRTLYAEEP